MIPAQPARPEKGPETPFLDDDAYVGPKLASLEKQIVNKRGKEEPSDPEQPEPHELDNTKSTLDAFQQEVVYPKKLSEKQEEVEQHDPSDYTKTSVGSNTQHIRPSESRTNIAHAQDPQQAMQDAKEGRETSAQKVASILPERLT